MAIFSFNSSKSCSILLSIPLDSVHLLFPKLFPSQIFTRPCSSNWRRFKGGATVICTNGKTWVLFSFFSVVPSIIEAAFLLFYFIFLRIFLWPFVYFLVRFSSRCLTFCSGVFLFYFVDCISEILCCFNDSILWSLCDCLGEILMFHHAKSVNCM